MDYERALVELEEERLRNRTAFAEFNREADKRKQYMDALGALVVTTLRSAGLHDKVAFAEYKRLSAFLDAASKAQHLFYEEAFKKYT